MEKIGLEAVFEDANFNKGITNYQNSIDAADKKTSGFSKIMGGIGGAAKIGIAGVIGIAGAAVGVAASLTGMVMKASDTAGELVDLSLKSGISVERLQELKYIGEQTGTSLETITSSTAKLTRAMGDVATNTAVAANFDKLGVSVYNTDGTLRDSQAVFTDVIGALGNVQNAAERDSLAMDIFGRSATELNPLIKTGGEGMAEMAQQARDMGIVMGEDAVMGLEGFGDSVATLKGALGGIVGKIATAVLPIVVDLTDTLVAFVKSPEFQAGIENLSKWLGENIPKVLRFLADIWTNVLQPALSKIYDFLFVTMMPIWEALGELIGVTLKQDIVWFTAAWENILKPALDAIWGFINTYIVPIFVKVSDSIGGITGAITTVVGWIQTFTEWLGKIKLPDWLTPGSPTPFEMGLRGIIDALILFNGSLFDTASAFSALGSAMAGRLTKTTLDPLEEKLKSLDKEIAHAKEMLKERPEFFTRHLVNLENERARYAEEYAAAQERILDLQKQQSDLGFLQQQMNFIDFLTKNKLDASEILKGIKLGLNADLPALLEAMTAAMKLLVGQAEGDLGIGSLSNGLMSPIMSLAPMATSNHRNMTLNMGGITLSNYTDEQSFISRVEFAVQRAMGV